MPQIFLILIVGLIAGMAVGVQAPLASLIGKQVGILESAFIVHLVGALSALTLLIALRGGNLGGWRNIPWYAYAAGGLGVLIISTLSIHHARAWRQHSSSSWLDSCLLQHLLIILVI